MTTPGYICNRADWPNGAETPPRADEIKLCSPFLNSQIALVAPGRILMQ